MFCDLQCLDFATASNRELYVARFYMRKKAYLAKLEGVKAIPEGSLTASQGSKGIPTVFVTLSGGVPTGFRECPMDSGGVLNLIYPYQRGSK